MADSKVALANVALAKLGANRITTFDEDSDEARVVNDVYDTIRDEVLAEGPWNFALKRKSLVLSADVLPFSSDGMTSIYAVPNDLVRIFFTSDPNAVYKMEANAEGNMRLLSNTANLGVIYVFRNDNPATYYSMFKTAFATRLASEIGFNLTESSKKAEALFQEYEKIRLPRALATDSQQTTPMQPIQDEWFVARLQGSSGYANPIPGQQTWHPI